MFCVQNMFKKRDCKQVASGGVTGLEEDIAISKKVCRMDNKVDIYIF